MVFRRMMPLRSTRKSGLISLRYVIIFMTKCVTKHMEVMIVRICKFGILRLEVKHEENYIH